MRHENAGLIKNERFLNLEGLRGLAAIMVVIYHVILIFYPNIVGLFKSPQHLKFEDWLHGSTFGGLYSGVFAVALFFVLSGFVLSIGFFQTGRQSVVKKIATKRYTRLMIPALISVVLACTIIGTGLSTYREVAVGIIGGGSAAVQWNFEPNLYDAIRQGVWSIFVVGDDSYNRVLWTMQYEFMGSFLVFITLLLFGGSKYRGVIYGFLLIATFGSWYMGFVIGMVFADIYKNIKSFMKEYRGGVRTGMIGIILIFGMILGGYPAVMNNSNPFYGLLYISVLGDTGNLSLYLTLGASMVVFSVLASKRVSNVLSAPKVSILGKYTYSLYLTHMLILLSFTVFIFVQANQYVGYNLAVAIAVIVSLPVLVVVTRLFYVYVDKLSIDISNHVADKMMR